MLIELDVFGDDRGLAFGDTALNIDWVLSEAALKLSDKDQQQPLLQGLGKCFDYGVNYYG